MHSVRLLGEGLERVWAAAEPPPNFQGPAHATPWRSLLLALVSQLVTASACEQFASEVQHSDATATWRLARVGERQERMDSGSFASLSPLYGEVNAG
jgi:hypothetical protein